jgi:phosphoribosyl-AMP cyclohydrolase
MRQVNLDEINFDKGKGLVPVVVQERLTGDVLTLAYANYDALKLTMETGFAHFFRRSHNKVMKKGITSGNFQRVLEILVDCDLDALLYSVEASGPACHTGESRCFHFKLNSEV